MPFYRDMFQKFKELNQNIIKVSNLDRREPTQDPIKDMQDQQAFLSRISQLFKKTQEALYSTVDAPIQKIAGSPRAQISKILIDNRTKNVSPRYNPEHVKELAATVFGEAGSNKEEMKAMIDTVLNRRNQTGRNILEVLTQKDKHGKSMYRAYGGPEYQKYLSGNLKGTGEPEKKKMLDNLINELQTGNWRTSEFTNFDKFEKSDDVKIGEHWFRKEFQGSRIRK